MRNRRRRAFTLVEMLVAMALIVFIMSILSEAFVAGLKTFRDLKAVGDMDQHLRTVTMLLRDDLSADHFTGKLRLSDPNFWKQGVPPREGFFRFVQMSAPGAVPPTGIPAPFAAVGTTPPRLGWYFDEGLDADGIDSFVASDHRLHFTVKRRGNVKDRFFTTPVPAGSPLLTLTNFDTELAAGDGRMQDPSGMAYSSQWAEVAYFLLPTVDGALGTSGGGPIGTPLYGLYRSEMVITPDNSQVNFTTPVAIAQLPQYQGASCNAGPTNIVFNNPSDLSSNIPAANGGPTTPAVQLRVFDPSAPAPNTRSSTLLMTNVISFHVQVLLSGVRVTDSTAGTTVVEPTIFKDLTDILTPPKPLPAPPVPNPPPPPAGSAWTAPWNPLDFDTGNIPAQLNCTISALKISIRVWDEKTLQARQITIIQDM